MNPFQEWRLVTLTYQTGPLRVTGLTRELSNAVRALLVTLLTLTQAASAGDQLAKGFAQPPPSARPWVYWFPLSGNLAKEGITADLEAMARVGIGGVLYMEVNQGAPKGPADFAGPLWRELFTHACNEAHRLGLEINMNNDAGSCGSDGPWEVALDPKWGGSQRVTSNQRGDWCQRPEPGIRYYSGKATYRKVFGLPSLAPGLRTYLNLGVVKNIARVRLNGDDLGVVWTAPWRVDITRSLRASDNQLENEVINLWPNRLIGDAGLPPDKRLTETNAKNIKPDMALFPSGLIGPVRIFAAEIRELG